MNENRSGRLGPKKILAIKFRALGDTVLWTPALAALNRLYPDAKLDVLSLESNRLILENQPGVDRFFGISKRDGWPLLSMLMRLRQQKYDLALAFHANTSLCRWLFLLGAKEKIAHHHSWNFTPRCSDRPLERPGVLLNAIERDYENLRALGWKKAPLPTHLTVTKEESDRGESRLRELGLKGAAQRLVLLPGASTALKRYPKDLWEKVVQDLQDSGRFELALMADPALAQEWDLKDFSQRLKIPVLADLGLREFLGTLSRFQVSVSSDSGPGHMAVALGLKSVHIFGQGCLGDFHPYDLNLHRYLRVQVDCRSEGPKELENFRFCTVKECSHLSCLRKITPSEVTRASLAVASTTG